LREDWRLNNPVEAILSACSTLFSVVNVKTFDETYRVIQFAHFTVKEFLMSSRFANKQDNISRSYHISMSAANTFVAQACLGVLLHLDETITSQNLTKYPLAGYAAKHWFEHARFEGVSQRVMEGMKQLFDHTKPYLSIWLWIHDPMVPYWRRRQRNKGLYTLHDSPIHYAAFCGLQDIAKMLAIEHPQDVNSKSVDDGSSPLHQASRQGHVELARMLIERGADVSAQEHDGSTALHLALGNGHADPARMLIENGADVSAQKNDGWTALHLVSRNGRVDLARMLIERGAGVSAQTKYGWTALHLASRDGDVDLARTLIERGADVSAQGNDGWTTLHLASLNGHVDLTRMLMERGANGSAQSNDGSTALHLASEDNHVNVVMILIERGADVSAQKKDGSTALHLASKNGYVDLARMLIDHGADVSAQDKDGSTALHFASEHGHVDLARMLKEYSTGLSLHTTPQITATT
jgi:ankyrin repeat protein